MVALLVVFNIRMTCHIHRWKNICLKIMWWFSLHKKMVYTLLFLLPLLAPPSHPALPILPLRFSSNSSSHFPISSSSCSLSFLIFWSMNLSSHLHVCSSTHFILILLLLLLLADYLFLTIFVSFFSFSCVLLLLPPPPPLHLVLFVIHIGRSVRNAFARQAETRRRNTLNMFLIWRCTWFWRSSTMIGNGPWLFWGCP